jgi:hypothetical protein
MPLTHKETIQLVGNLFIETRRKHKLRIRINSFGITVQYPTIKSCAERDAATDIFECYAKAIRQSPNRETSYYAQDSYR